MTEFIKEKTCCVSGHRILPADFDTGNLYKVLEKTVFEGYSTFLVGMAVGFDTVCFHVLEKLRKKYGVKIIACVPCRNQADRFSKVQRDEYIKMLVSADEKIVLQEKYDVLCMKKRNEFMVDNSSKIVCYLTRNSGGTYQTVKYAVDSGASVDYIKF